MATQRKTAGRTTNTKRLGSIMMQPAQFERLELIASADGRSISDVVRDAIREYLARRTA
jgi:predicted transcriptional regulator